MEEIWKDIPEWEGYYQCSNLGRVKSLARIGPNEHRRKERILKPNSPRRGKNPSQGGYQHICCMKNGAKRYFNIHRLVAELFVPNPDNKTVVNHKDNNRLNNISSNLEWVTPKENSQHARDLGVHDVKGENSGLAKYTDEIILDIRDQFAKGAARKRELADKYGMSWNNVNRIIKREIWTHI